MRSVMWLSPKADRRLQARIIQGVAPAVGQHLRGAKYLCLKHETDGSDLEEPTLYIGGEAHLEFTDRSLIITWDENAGWADHFSLYAGTESKFLPNSDMEWWDATKLEPWKGCVGRKLTRVEVYGESDTPHIIGLSFDSLTVYIGDGFELRFGGGDLLVRCREDMIDLSSWSLMWNSADAAA